MGYAKLADGKVEKLNVVEELNRAIDEVFPPAAGFKVEVRRNFAPDLPVLLMQRTHLWEIFVNLLQNAREAVGDGGRIEVSAEQEPGWSVIVTIADNGPGIPPERQEQIFESYFTTKEKGSGLGLAIVKHNVEIHGGTVRVESALGRGARFILTFPAKTLFRPENEPPPHSGRR
jgi:signal transduction histidine kinase